MTYRARTMGVLNISLATTLFILVLSTSEAAVDLSCQVQRTISQLVTGGQCPDSSVLRLCPSEVITCTCFGEGLLLEWKNSLFAASLVFINLGIAMTGDQLVDIATGATAVVTAVNPRENITSDINFSVTTTTTINAIQFNNTAIRCEDASGPAEGIEQMIFLFAPPPAPAIAAVGFNAATSFTTEWSEPSGSCEMSDSFGPQISPNDLRCTMNGMTYTCSYSEAHLGQMYTFTVSAFNCGTQRGEEASVSVNLRVPNQSNLTTIPLYGSSGHLLEIKSWASVVPQVFIADGVDNSNEYIFTYESGSDSLNFTHQCTGGSCQHTFSVPNSSQVQQYTLSVAVRNVVGVGTASEPVTIDSLNNVFDVIVDIEVPEAICQFQNGPVTSATCTIEYGKDPTYLNLPYIASSTGTDVTNVTIPLSASLQHATLYYYIVSTMGVRMQGTFRSSCTHADLGIVDATPDERCTGLRSSAQFTGGVVCYSGLTPGSFAVYVCNSTHHLDGSRFRRCQSNGNWSGSAPHCVEVPPEIMGTTVGLDAGAVVGVSITIFLLSFTFGTLLAAVICGLRWRVKSSGQPHTSPSEDPQPGPVYEMVEEHQVDKLEMKENIAYGPVSH